MISDTDCDVCMGSHRRRLRADKHRAKPMAPLLPSSRPVKYNLFADLLTSVANDQKLNVGPHRQVCWAEPFAKASCLRLQDLIA
jgi:hypothetical protein